MSDTTQSKVCLKCGAAIPAEAPQGLCPKCLLLQASLATEAGTEGASNVMPPTSEELAAAFPQLEILGLIGQGGMGFVFKARQARLERFVALKILPQSLAADPTFAERFSREARMLARLNHPNIVTVHDFGQANGLFYLMMEFVDGVNLRQTLSVGRFTPQQALGLVPKICDALQFAHNEGILHRDIKPENILLDSKGRVKIADFGIAKLIAMETQVFEPSVAGERPKQRSPGASTLTEPGKTLGTPYYMAPEQLEHPEDVDQRADIYSLGVVFYEMLTGELPLGRFAAPSEKSAVDARVDEIVLRALEKEREYRQKSVAEVKNQVETIATTAGGAIAGLAAVTSAAITNPDRFWRRFAVTIFAAVTIPLLLIIMGLVVPKLNALRQARIGEEQARHAQASAEALSAEGKLVICPPLYTRRNLSGELHWVFDLYLPATNLISILFVRWDKGVPSIDPGFSAYYRVRETSPVSGFHVGFCTIACDPVAQSQFAAMNNAEGQRALAQIGLPMSVASELTNVSQWNVNLGLPFTSNHWLATPAYHRVEMVLPQTVRSGYQRAVRLLDFQAPEPETIRPGQPGIELRILVEPLSSAPIKTVSFDAPHEIVHGSYDEGSGLAGSMEQALHSMMTLPIEP